MVKQATNSDHNSSAGHLEYEIKTSFACIKQAAQWLNRQKAKDWQTEHPKNAKGTQAQAIVFYMQSRTAMH